MYGYVFLSYGALKTLKPERYPARQDQIENLRSAFDALGEREPKIVIEKALHVYGLDSLPKLKSYMRQAFEAKTFVLVDDIGRIFYRCPVNLRGKLRRELKPLLPLIREVSRECQQASTRTPEELRELLYISGPVRFRTTPRMRRERSPDELAHQTALARAVSASERTKLADARAVWLQELRRELLETQDRVTLQQLAEEANRRGLRTARSVPWSAATVKRSLDRPKAKEESED